MAWTGRRRYQKAFIILILAPLCLRLAPFSFYDHKHLKNGKVFHLSFDGENPFLANLMDSSDGRNHEGFPSVDQPKPLHDKEDNSGGIATGIVSVNTKETFHTNSDKRLSYGREMKHSSIETIIQDALHSTKQNLQQKYTSDRLRYSENLKSLNDIAKTISTLGISNGKVNVYTYHDVFTDFDNLNLHWNPLFPHIPRRGFFATKLEDDDWVHETISRRFLGYLHANKTGYYTFKFYSTSPLDFLLFDESFSKDKILLRLGQLSTGIRKSNVFRGVSKEIWLEQGKAYPIDLIHSCIGRGRFLLRWKERNWPIFAAIGFRHLSSLHSNTSVFSSQPDSYVYTGGVPELRRKFQNDSRIHFGSKIQLTSKSSKTGLEACAYKPSYLFLGNKLILYYGQLQLRKEKIYPNDNANYKANDVKMDRFLGEDTAKAVANDVFAAVNKANNGIFELQNIVHVEENHDKKRYLVELDLKSKVDGKIYRFSDYFLRPDKSRRLCLPEGYSQWNHQAKIYLICVVKNQRQWFQYLIKSLEDLIKRTGDRNLHLVTVDFHSTDGDLQSLLKNSKLNYTFLQLTGKFSKVVGLNEGVRHIHRNDSIVFIMDLNLQIPDHIFDQARKHTIEGLMTYCPVLLRMPGTEHPEYTKVEDSAWMEIGYGMMSIYKSDWLRVGGMNETFFKYKWGGEDWEFVDRVVMSRLEIVHPRLPGFYHIYHSTIGTWDGSKTF
eukprot:gene15640-6924_t